MRVTAENVGNFYRSVPRGVCFWKRFENSFTTSDSMDSPYFIGLQNTNYGQYKEQGSGKNYKGEFIAYEGKAEEVDQMMRAYHPNRNLIKALLRIS